MNFLADSISPKYPFKDTFQKDIERNTREFFQKTYGGALSKGSRRSPNKSLYQAHVRQLLEDAHEEIIVDGHCVNRLVYLEVKTTEKGIFVTAHPEETIERIQKSGDLRPQRGLIEPVLNTFRWAIGAGVEFPLGLDIKIFFWLADKPPWTDKQGFPIFIPSGIPYGLNFPLYPDVSYFYMQFDKKYTGEGLTFDAYKRIFDASPNSTLEDIVYFKGADTTRYNSKLRSYIVNELPKMIGKEHTDLAIVDGFTQFDPLYTDGQGKRYLLDLPGLFPWSVRLKFLFLFNGGPTVIKVNERWVANDRSWADPVKPWQQWIDTFLPEEAYISVTHTHTQMIKKFKDDIKSTKRAEGINRVNREKTVKKIAEIQKRDLRAPDPELGHKIVTKLSNDRIYQMIFRTIMTLHALGR